jgi:hypothetical protein
MEAVFMAWLASREAFAVAALGVALASLGCGADAGTTPNLSPDASTPFPDASADDGPGPPPPPGDAGPPPPSCSPADVSSFTPTWKPPVGPYTGACTSVQLDKLITSCFDTSSTQAMCDTWVQNAANAACLTCWLGPMKADHWAPIVYTNNPGETDYVNFPGCVELADPQLIACAQAIEANITCDLQACLSNCPVPQDPASTMRSASITALNACFGVADLSGCTTFSDPANKCVGTLDGGTASFCLSASKDPMALRQFFGLACGAAPTGPPDAGGD